MGTERKKPNLKLLSPTPGLVTLITATFLFPGNYRSPWLSEQQTLETHRLSSCLCHLRCWLHPGPSHASIFTNRRALLTT